MNPFELAYKQLNQAQKKAVDTLYGPVAVIAGPGTGKTQVLSVRIGNILHTTDTEPSNILAITFTEAGAYAMRERLRSFFGSLAYQVPIYTFHGFCERIIRENVERFQFGKELKMIEDLEKNRLIGNVYLRGNWKYLYNRHDPEMYLGETIQIISKLKREGISPSLLREKIDEAITGLPDNPVLHYQRKFWNKNPGDKKPEYFKEEIRLQKQKEIADIYEVYLDMCHEKWWYDFDDMIAMVVQELKKDENFRLELQERYQFIHVDEFQDTNSLQAELIWELTKNIEKPNIFVVGDDEQSIYRFQGAIMKNILSFHENFAQEGLTTVILTENYRSTQTILDAARSVMSKNEESLEKSLHLNKKLHANTQENTPCILFTPSDPNLEITYISDQIRGLLQEWISAKEIAIIYRKNAQGTLLADHFRREGIAFQKLHGENLFHISFTQTLLKSLQSILHPTESQLLWDVLLFWYWWIWFSDILQLQEEKLRWESLWDALQKSNMMMLSRPRETFFSLIPKVGELSAVEFFELFLVKTDLREYIRMQENYLEMLNVLNAFFNEIKRFNFLYPMESIREFIAYFSDLEKYHISPHTQPLKTQDDAVSLMTAHGSKGLEFSYVFLFQTSEKYWEKSRDPGKLKITVPLVEEKINPTIDHDLEEERRLFYVALTRAKKQITITALSSQHDKSLPSRFIYEIPENLRISVDTYTPSNLQVLESLTKPHVPVHWDEESRKILQERAKNYVLSVTHLNTWIRSPKEFCEQYLVRKPSAKSYSASLGTVVHALLKEQYESYEKNGIFLSEKEIQESVEKHFLREYLGRKEYEKACEEASSIVLQYVENKHNCLTKKAQVEKYIGHPFVLVEEVKMKWIIDRLEFLGNNLYKVIDFKTGKSDKGKEGLEDYERQLYFYKLLIENSAIKWMVTEGMIEFVEDIQNGEIQRKMYSFSEEKMDSLRKIIRAFRVSLESLDFPEKNTFLL